MRGQWPKERQFERLIYPFHIPKPNKMAIDALLRSSIILRRKTAIGERATGVQLRGFLHRIQYLLGQLQNECRPCLSARGKRQFPQQRAPNYYVPEIHCKSEHKVQRYIPEFGTDMIVRVGSYFAAARDRFHGGKHDRLQRNVARILVIAGEVVSGHLQLRLRHLGHEQSVRGTHRSTHVYRFRVVRFRVRIEAILQNVDFGLRMRFGRVKPVNRSADRVVAI